MHVTSCHRYQVHFYWQETLTSTFYRDDSTDEIVRKNALLALLVEVLTWKADYQVVW